MLRPLICLVILAPIVLAGGYQRGPHGTVSGHAEFTGQATLHSFSGVSDALAGTINLDSKQVDFQLELRSLETGNGTRDRNMREALEVDRFPRASFRGELVSHFDINATGEQQAQVRGEFEVHGVTQTLTIVGSLENQDNGVRMRAEWTLAMSDFDIDPPGNIIVRTRDEIDVRVNAMLTER